ncbi:MAG: ABC transporter permease [Clostridiales bacterium]|nr:ABC transporter permease [Clostridiales bacterium]
MQSLNVLTASAMQQFRTSIGRPMFRFCVLVQPIIFGLLLGMMYLEKSDMDFTLYAVFGSGLSTFWASICFSSASDIHRERWYGTLETIYAAPAGFKWIVLGKIIGNSIWGFLSICISFSVVTLVFQKQIVISNYLWLGIGLILMTLSLIAIG